MEILIYFVFCNSFQPNIENVLDFFFKKTEKNFYKSVQTFFQGQVWLMTSQWKCGILSAPIVQYYYWHLIKSWLL